VFSISRKLLSLLRVAAMLLVIAQPVLAADCPCRLEKGGPNSARPSEDRQECSKRCCGHKPAKHNESAKSTRQSSKPCECPDQCPCHQRHNAEVVSDRLEEATDQLDGLGKAIPCPVSHLSTPSVLAPALSANADNPSLRAVVTSKEFCAIICRLTI